MGGEHPRFWVAFSILLLAFAFFTIMSVWMTIQAHAGAGFVEWHKVFYDAAMPSAPSVPPTSAPVVRITDDPGGNVAQYYRKYSALNAAGAEVHFHGLCASACGIILFAEFTNIRACADEGAIFGFHKPFQDVDGKIIRTKKAVRETRKLWAAWLSELSLPLRHYLQTVRVPSAAEGDEQNTMLVIPASALMPRCPVSVAAQ